MHVVKFVARVLRQVGLTGSHTPLEATAICFHLAHDNVEEGREGDVVTAEEGHLVITTESEGDVV